MPTPRAVLRPLALGLMLGAPGLPLAAADGRATFDFYVAGIRVGELSFQTEQADGSYSAAGRVEAAGLVGVFADFFFDGAASGDLRADGTVVPRRFVADSKSPRADRHTEIEWRDGTPVRVSVEPPRSSAPDPAAQAGTLDPVSASFAVLRDAPADGLCDTTVQVFDGSRRSRLRLAAPVADGGQITCEGNYARIEGEAHSLSSQREFPFRLVFHENADGLAQLQRIETRMSFGSAVIERRS